MFDKDKGIDAERIKNISKQIKSGAQYENPIIELKQEFWDLSKDEGKNEFAKDLTVMANSQYGGGNIIVGIDGENGDLYHTVLPSDAAKLADIINRKVLEPFTVEFNEYQVDEKNIIVIHIPRSYNKPHMLRLFKNREMFIPIRKGTRTQAADKYDLDLMYTEREKIVIPPYRLEPFIGQDELIIHPTISSGLHSWRCLINVLNTGSRINMITGGSLTIYSEGEEINKLELTSYTIPEKNNDLKMQNGNYTNISQNDAITIILNFHIEDQKQYTHLNAFINSYSARISLNDVSENTSFTKDIKIRFHKLW